MGSRERRASVRLRRREWLAAVGLGVTSLSGCLSQSGDGSDQTTTSTRSQADPQAGGTTQATQATPTATQTPQDRSGPNTYTQIGTQHQAQTGLAVTVNEVTLARSITLTDGSTVEPGDGNVLLLAQIRTENTASETLTLPGPRHFDVLVGGSQYSNYRSENYLGDGNRLLDPVEGVFYTGVQEAHPEIGSKGWLLFAVPESASAVTLAYSGRSFPEESDAYWEVGVDPQQLPDVSVAEVIAPNGPVEIGEKVTLKVAVQNTGGSPGVFDRSYQFSCPGMEEKRGSLTAEVDGGDAHRFTLSCRPSSLGSITLSLGGQTVVTRSVEAATQRFGASFRMPDGPILTCSDVTLSDSYAYRSYDGTEVEEAPSGEQFVFVRIRAQNPTSESVTLPATDGTILTWKGASRSPATTPQLGAAEFVRPVSGKQYVANFAPSLGAGKQLDKWLIFTAPADASRDELALTATWSVGWDSTVKATWVGENASE